MTKSHIDPLDPGLLSILSHAAAKAELMNKPNYGDYRTTPADRFMFTRLGRILEVNNDSNTATVLWLDQPGSRSEVPICHPYAGPRGHILAMPEISAIALVGFTLGIRPYIFGYMPFNYPLMVELTQFPERVEDVNFAMEQFIKTHVSIREDYNLVQMTSDQINDMRNLEIESRIVQSRLEQHSISKPWLDTGEISIASANGSEIRFDTDLTMSDMNGDEIKLVAEDNSIHISSMHLIIHNEAGSVFEGQIRRPFGIREPKPRRDEVDNSAPLDSKGSKSLLETLADPMMDRLWYPIGRLGRLDEKPSNGTNKNERELLYQFKTVKQMPLVERLVTTNEFSDSSLFIEGESNLIPLPENEWFKISKATIERNVTPSKGEKSNVGETSAAFEATIKITEKDTTIEAIADTNPFRPIENRYTTYRKEDLEASYFLRKDSLFSDLKSLLGIDKKYFATLYQELVTIGVQPLRKKQESPTKASDAGGDQAKGDPNKGKIKLSKDLETRLKELRDALKTRITGNQLGLVLDDKTINSSYGGIFKDTKTGGSGGVGDTDTVESGKNFEIRPIGPLIRHNSGTLVDGHDRMIKDPFSFERISFQFRQQTGMFINVDRRGSVNANMTNLLANTVGMSFYSGFIHRRILETKIGDKYTEGGKPTFKIYLPEPIPTDTKSQAGKVLNIDQEDASSGSDPRSRKENKSADDGKKFFRSDIGQIPSTPKKILPPPERVALKGAKDNPKIDSSRPPEKGTGQDTAQEPGGAEDAKGEPLKFLNELQIKIPKHAKIKPPNDIVDPSIVSYDPPRTKELDWYSFQVEKRLWENNFYKDLKKELADYDKLDRFKPFVELTYANVVDRDGTIIRSSMTQKSLAHDLSVNTDKHGNSTYTIDHEANVDAAHNNIYTSFNSGFMESGMAYKVKKKDEDVDVRLKAESGTTPDENNPNDIPESADAKEDKINRKAFDKKTYKKIGLIGLYANARTIEKVRTLPKTPGEIEKEEKHKKIEDRKLRAPKENLLPLPDTELQMGGVVEDNHSQAVKEAIGFINKNLHYRVKKNIKKLPDPDEPTDDGSGGSEEDKKLGEEDGLKQKLDDLETDTYPKLKGPQNQPEPASPGPAKDSETYSLAKKKEETNATKQEIKQESEQEKQKLDEFQKGVDELSDKIAKLMDEASKSNSDLQSELSPSAKAFYFSSRAASGPAEKGITFPKGFGGSPGSCNKPGTAASCKELPNASKEWQPPVPLPGGTTADGGAVDPRFPGGVLFTPTGEIVSGQASVDRAAGGIGVNPITGKKYSGTAFNGGGCSINKNGAIEPPAEIPEYFKLGAAGEIVLAKPEFPPFVSVNYEGVWSSMPNPGDPNSPHNNAGDIFRVTDLFPIAGTPRELSHSASSESPPFLSTVDIVEKSSKNLYIIKDKSDDIYFTPNIVSAASVISKKELEPNKSSIGAFPTANTPNPAEGAGAAKKPAKTTIIEIDRFGNWACKSDQPAMNQTIINNLSQLQLGSVREKNESNRLKFAQSVLGPLSHTRLSQDNGAGADFDAIGNSIFYATSNFLIKADYNGEVRAYGDLKLISDKRSVIAQGHGGPVLGKNERGSMDGGIDGSPTAELVLGRMEHKGGDIESSPFNSIFDKEVNVALTRHFGSSSRTLFAIDAGGNLMAESSDSGRCLRFGTPATDVQIDHVVDKNGDGVVDATSPLGGLYKYRAKVQSGSVLGIDSKGNTISDATGRALMGAAGDIIITSQSTITINASSVYINAGDKIVLTAGTLIQLSAPEIIQS